MKRKIIKTKTVFIIAMTGLLLAGCTTRAIKKGGATPNFNMEFDNEIVETIEKSIDLINKEDVLDSLNSESQYLCESIKIPQTLRELNRNEVYSSNVSLDVNTSLQAYGFGGKMGKKDVLIIAYFTKFKDYICNGNTVRAQVGLKLYVHASDLKVKVSSPSLSVIAAATELGQAKAEYKFETFGITPDDFYQKLPSAQFTVDTYSKIISAYDNIVHSLDNTTAIDPIITYLPKHTK